MTAQLKLFDNLTGIDKTIMDKSKPIKIFNCGPTVSDFIHIGHFRNALLVDVLIRILSEIGYKDVLYVSNVSNISQKIYNRSLREKDRSWSELGMYYMYQWIKDLSVCNVITPNIIMPDTNHVNSIINFVQNLLNMNVAYETQKGVYYKIKYLHDIFDKNNIKNLPLIKAIHDNNEDILILEKVFDSSDNMVWNSPWGNGRPGKHIPCSDVIDQYCGEDDYLIHCAGDDLYYHHSCEISHNLIGKKNSKIADIWVYNSLVNVEDQKMGKSLGNSVPLRELIKRYSPESIRWYLLSFKFSSVIKYSEKDHSKAALEWEKIESKIKNFKKVKRSNDNKFYYEKVIAELSNNLNTAKALQIINAQTVNSIDISVINTSVYLLDMLGFNIENII